MRNRHVTILLPATLLLLLTTTAFGANEPRTLQPLFDERLDQVLASPRWIGFFTIAGSMFPLLMGWWLIRWTTSLITAGVVGAVVLFVLHDRVATEWMWTGALSCGALGGIVGWFLYPVLFALQTALLAGLGMFIGVSKVVHGMPVLAVALAVGAAVVGGLIGLRLAPWAAIAQTVVSGFLGILTGMTILCQPRSDGELLLLTVLVGAITIPAGAWVQVRAHRRTEQP